MEEKMDPNDTESTETAPPEAGGRVRRRIRLGAGWRFARHLLEMVVAMMAGMAALDVALWALGEPPGYSNPLVEYGLTEQAQRVWVEPPPGLTVVACDGPHVLGTAHMEPNRPGPGSHVATASFMVASDARGRGVGRALGEYALSWAREQGYAAM